MNIMTERPDPRRTLAAGPRQSDTRRARRLGTARVVRGRGALSLTLMRVTLSATALVAIIPPESGVRISSAANSTSHFPKPSGGCLASRPARNAPQPGHLRRYKRMEFMNVLGDPDRPAEERRVALRFVVHLVGDLHQPLHVGENHDKGRNDL